MAPVAHPYRSRVGGQGQLVARTAVAIDVAAVPTVVLPCTQDTGVFVYTQDKSLTDVRENTAP